MANERPVINLTKSTQPTAEMRKEFKAKLASVITRGFIVDRLNVGLPDDMYGEWVSDDPVAIAEAQALGFEIDKDFATKYKLHSNAAGEAKVGDAIYMTMPKWMKEEIDITKQEHLDKIHGVKGKPVEETQYAANISKETPIINESKLNNVSLTTMVSDG